MGQLDFWQMRHLFTDSIHVWRALKYYDDKDGIGIWVEENSLPLPNDCGVSVTLLSELQKFQWSDAWCSYQRYTWKQSALGWKILRYIKV